MGRTRYIAAIFIFAAITICSIASAEMPLLTKYNGLGHEGVESETGRYWVFFTDKGTHEELLKSSPQTVKLPLSERAIRRRAMRASDTEPVMTCDLPVEERYIQQITDAGFEVHTVSRLLNAVSVVAVPEQLPLLDDFDFVSEIRPVLRFRRERIPVEKTTGFFKAEPMQQWSLDYGKSLGQLQMMLVPHLHEQGLTGAGVMIAIFDTGFKMGIEAYENADIVATYDFIHEDEDVDDNDALQVDHGTSVLSVMGGALDGELYGPAFGASFLLAKTEDERNEIPIEEEYFVEAIDWAEALGCDIISASLGYTDWFDFSDMDGNTATTTIACDAAASRGVTVVVSAGNERLHLWGHVSAPADGDSVIAVGAVDPNGLLTSFSSPGPTADGRIKPDICAQGTSVWAAGHWGGFYNFSGTSAAAPLAAGAIALLLELHPDWGPIDVRNAIWSTARKRGDRTYPNNDYGYGIVDAAAASGLFGTPTGTNAVIAYPNPFDEWVRFKFPGEASAGMLYIFALDGSKVFEKPLASAEPIYEYEWDGRNSSGNEVAAGIYIVKITGIGFEELVKVAKVN
ncbi:MAG: S8 family serine peptidase [candidate division Zixibacteria bacterium]|nr:S8 family serine peptidase [candidate division Zixibacteria bacterium]